LCSTSDKNASVWSSGINCHEFQRNIRDCDVLSGQSTSTSAARTEDLLSSADDNPEMMIVAMERVMVLFDRSVLITLIAVMSLTH